MEWQSFSSLPDGPGSCDFPAFFTCQPVHLAASSPSWIFWPRTKARSDIPIRTLSISWHGVGLVSNTWQTFSEAIQAILNSRKESSRKCCLAKWKIFSIWAQRCHMSPEESGTGLSPAGLSLSSLRVHLAVISTCHPSVVVHSIFTHPVTVHFLKGLVRIFTPITILIAVCAFDWVLSALTKPLFELLAGCSMSHLLIKLAFRVAIIPARRVGELGTLLDDPLYTVFHKDEVSLRLHPKFTTKVISDLPINQTIQLPIFFQSLMPALKIRDSIPCVCDKY